MATRIQRKNSRRRRSQGGSPLGLALIGVAIVLAAFILRGGGTSSNSSDNESATFVAQYDTIELPVPARLIAVGTRAQDIPVKYVAFPKHQIPEGAIRDLEVLGTSRAVAALPANLPLFAENFQESVGSSNSVTKHIPAGMRAITVRVDATSAVEGWARSGAIVDVLLVERDRTTVVAESVRVLSVEGQVAPINDEGSPSIPSTMTILVTQEQALAVSTAIPRGDLRFALKGMHDEGNWDDKVFTAERLHGNRRSKGAGVQGFIAVKNEKGEADQQFALSDGRWVKSSGVPTGILIGKDKKPAKEDSVTQTGGEHEKD